MVAADDEHTSTNEPEDNTSTQKSFFEKLKFWKRCKNENGEPAPLQPLPACLMKWKAPVVIAGAGFLIALSFAIIWHGTPHWPSADAMKLCATIAGAGFAFSAWQQRSHDNAANAKREQAAIERDDYWKRREHILHTLDSNNPRIRLAAISLLAELADKAEDSSVLNGTEKQQLQRHIINTLCLQLRHEGLNQKREGTRDEHAEIQNAILQVILERIQHTAQRGNCANWSSQYINLQHCDILTKVTISQIQTNATLDFRDSVFQEQVEIRESHIGRLFWRTAYFTKQLVTVGENSRTVIKTDGLPQHADIAYFFNTTFISAKQGLILDLQTRQNDETIPSLSFIQCDFRKTTCDCPTTCQCRDGAETTDCSCKAEDECMCTNTCKRNKLWIQTNSAATQSNYTIRELSIYTCEASDIQISLETDTPRIYISDSRITNLFKIAFEYNYTAVRSPATQETPAIIVHNCIFTRNQPSLDPVHIAVNTPSTINEPIYFFNNSTFDLSGTGATHKLNTIAISSRYDSYHFTEVDDSNNTLASWDTGLSTTPISIHRDNNPFSAFACGEHADADSIQFRVATKADRESILELSDQSKNIESSDTFGRPTPNEYIRHEILNALIVKGTLYLVTDSKGPLAAFAFIPGSNSAYAGVLNGWHSSSDYHTICYVTAVRGRGIAHAIFSYVANRASYVRCDTSENNIAMRHALEAFGFQECGTFTAEDGGTRIAYDWIKELEPQN